MSQPQNTKTAVIFMGLQASGKSAYYHQNYASTHAHINLDRLRTRRKERLLLDECIRNGRPFVVDNTNPTVRDRARYIQPARQAGYRVIGLFFQSRVAECMARNERRSDKAKVPAAAIAVTSNRLELPRTAEGFDELYFVSMEDDSFIVEKWEDER